MFFTAELLAKRDSGFGLLWLAATLGSKSTFKKLPKRSVLTADISQLCDLIAEPAEPLALRLSSNLMVGVARVYKVKQEIFLTDITTCFNSLKKVVQDLRSISLTEAQLQMAQPSVKPSALTLTPDPRVAFAADFDNLVADWDEFLGVDGNGNESEADDDFDPTRSKKNKQREKARASATENLRANLHTLNENHAHLLSASFDTSLNQSGDLAIPSSSQFDAGFGFAFDDNFFGMSDGLDIGGEIGDELARELGEGWAAAPSMLMADQDMIVDDGVDFNLDAAMDMYANDDFQLPDGAFGAVSPSPANILSSAGKTGRTNRKTHDKENMPPPFSRASSLTARIDTTPISFSQQLLEQDSELPLPVETVEPRKKTKRVRLLLDPRTELTDEELKTARAQYLHDQIALRNAINQKKIEKESGKIIEKLMWGVPTGLQAQALADFWLDNYKIQVEARSGALQFDVESERPRKRRKTRDADWGNDGMQFIHADAMSDLLVNVGMDMDMDGGDFGADEMMVGSMQLRSSEEPGQGRLGSPRPPSIRGSNFGLDFGQQNSQGASQRSALFPWDNAGDIGPSSSVDGAVFDFGNEELGLDQVEVRLKGSSASARSRRASSQLMSRVGSLGEPGSPLKLVESFPLEDDNFAFEVPENNSVTIESQHSDFKFVNLERNSFNFLEYAKMQYQSLPGPNASLTFEDVVPKASSNAHIASSALYHCLVLGTKDLARFDQPEAYGPITITITT